MIDVRPRRRLDLGVEPDVLQQAVLLGEVAEVSGEHVLGGVVHRPVVALGERVAVVVARVVDTAPRIGVLPPRPADLLVLLQHHEGDPGLLQAVGSEQPGHPGADDGDLVAHVGGQLLLRPARCPTVLAGHPQLLLEQRHVLAHHLGAGGELHHRHQVVLRRRRDRRRPGIAVAAQHVEGEVPGGGLLLVGQAALRLGDPRRIDPQVVAQQRQVTSHVGQRHEQRRQHRVPQDLPQLIVIGRDHLRHRQAHHPLVSSPGSGPHPCTANRNGQPRRNGERHRSSTRRQVGRGELVGSSAVSRRSCGSWLRYSISSSVASSRSPALA